MLQYEELKFKLNDQIEALNGLAEALELDKLRMEVEMLEHKTAEPGFWDDMEKAQKVTQKLATLKGRDEDYQKLVSRSEDCMALIEMADEAEDLSFMEEVETEIADIEKKIGEMRLTTLLTGEYDSRNAILTFHAGFRRNRGAGLGRNAFPYV